MSVEVADSSVAHADAEQPHVAHRLLLCANDRKEGFVQSHLDIAHWRAGGRVVVECVSALVEEKFVVLRNTRTAVSQNAVACHHLAHA